MQIDVRNVGSIPGSERSTGGGQGQPTPVFLPGESHGQRSLAVCSPWGRTESDMTEATYHAHNPIPCPILLKIALPQKKGSTF